jgi:uncharacterized membrane protein (DUF4010 family)
MMEETSLFLRFGVALVIGLVIGLQREYAFDEPNREIAAGIRTFPLIALIGCAASFFSDLMDSPWPFVGVLFLLGAFLVANYIMEARAGKMGLTTKVAAVLTVLIGSLVYYNEIALGVALGVATVALLSAKHEMHAFAHHITRADVYATLKLAVISAIILPVLPNRVFGIPPFDIFNPFKIWLLVVFISGMSFIGYVMMKVTGTRRGIDLTGLFGGLVSSTALTISLSNRSRENPALSRSFARAIILAWTVMYLRAAAVVAALNMLLVKSLWIPLGVSMAAGLAYWVLSYRAEASAKTREEIGISNPFELGPALKFGLLFVVILFASKSAQVYFGNAGVYLSSLIAGFADMDAVALSMAKFSRGPGAIGFDIAARSVVLATVANTVVKGLIAVISGAPELRKAILPGFILMLVTGIVVAFFCV